METPFPKKQWTKQEKDQLYTLTKIDMIKLLDKDERWEFKGANGARYVYENKQCPKPFDHVAIHHHRERYHHSNLLMQLIDNICWTRESLKKWKVFK
jgi:hypothetical protein